MDNFFLFQSQYVFQPQVFGTFFTEITIGWNITHEAILESKGEVEVCVVVFMPQLPCPISFPFEINVFTTNDKAGEGSNIFCKNEAHHCVVGLYLYFSAPSIWC